jgi:uncharacterized protein with HEPN domain
MTPRDVRAFLLDVLERIEETRRFVGAASRAEFLGSRLLQTAVEREFIVIGEAVTRVVALRPDFEARIGSARQIIGLRNRLVHAYMGVDPNALFGVVETHLTPLERDVQALLNELGA